MKSSPCLSIKAAAFLFSALAAGHAQTVTLDTGTYPIPGSTDESFTPIRLADQGGRPLNAPDVIVLPDGKIVAVGEVQDGDETLFVVRRWHADGEPDESFRPPRLRIRGCTGYPNKVVGQPDGRILIVGCHPTPDGGPQSSELVRLEADGTLDTAFRPNLSGDVPRHIVTQSNGKILVAGREHLRRLRPEGSIDPGFQVWDLSSAANVALTLQPDGRILMRTSSGNSDTPTPLPPLVRLLADGTLDPSFGVSPEVLAAIGKAGNNDPTFRIGLARDGRILVAAHLRHPPPLNRDTSLVRLNADGSLDSGFTSSLFGKPLHEQADGRWLIVGYGLGSIVRRIDPDGPEAKENFIYWQSGLFMTIQSDDKLLAGIDPLTRIHASSVPFSFRELTVTGLRTVRLTLNSPRYGGNNHSDAPYVLEAATDLRTWIPLSTNTATGLTLEFEDADAPNLPRRFYRARLVNP